MVREHGHGVDQLLDQDAPLTVICCTPHRLDVQVPEQSSHLLETHVRQINRTNALTPMPEGCTVTDTLAERDVLLLRYSLLSGAADAVSGTGHRGAFMRATRSELKVVTALDVGALRQRASEVARRTRELDAQIQQANWMTELVEQ